MLRWTLIGSVGYLGLAIVLLLGGNATLIAIPFALGMAIVDAVRRPPSWRLARVIRSLKTAFRRRTPSIVATRTMEWSADVPTVYLLCSAESEVSQLWSQLEEIRVEISLAAHEARVPTEYLAGMQLWPLSREELDREGGWFAFDHNVSSPKRPHTES